jgi:TonB family protein
LNTAETLDDEPVTPKKPDTRLKELEFASLTDYTKKPETKQDEKSSADLLKELTAMKQPTLRDKEPAVVQTQEFREPSVSEEKSKAYDSILKKLDSLETKPNDIESTVAAPETVVQSFQSDIRNVSAPKQVQVDLVISPNQAYVQSSLPGEPGADALSLYKGLIIKKVMENWNAPLGQDHDKRVVISFNIFPQGNIDRPDLQRSSQVELLDNLALRAIRASAPFPKFPESLKSSNLNISIHFKYIQEKNKT